MNWPRIILDGLSMSLLFNAVVGLGFLLAPQAYSTMFPKEIRQAAAPYVQQKEGLPKLAIPEHGLAVAGIGAILG